jgi:ABC-type lipoprotein export system ATPase subunit
MIRAIDLSYAYPGGELLRFPPVALEPGQSLVLRGNSGSGKSTWLALVAGLLTASQGELCVAGQDLSALSASARDGWRARTIGFLPQKLHLSAALTVQKTLPWCTLRRASRRIARPLGEAWQRLVLLIWLIAAPANSRVAKPNAWPCACCFAGAKGHPGR